VHNHLKKQAVKKLILRLLVVILAIGGVVGYVNGATPASNCNIATCSTSIGTGKVSYSQVGTGQPILLLHGLFASKEQWYDMMCQLSEAGYRAIAPDLPGYGSSTGFTVRDYALENQAALLHQFTDRLGMRSLHIAGSSMGGAIALQISNDDRPG
jgi:pimeloyl-ACP methyl ester carboxylesterase